MNMIVSLSFLSSYIFLKGFIGLDIYELRSIDKVNYYVYRSFGSVVGRTSNRISTLICEMIKVIRPLMSCGGSLGA